MARRTGTLRVDLLPEEVQRDIAEQVMQNASLPPFLNVFKRPPDFQSGLNFAEVWGIKKEVLRSALSFRAAINDAWAYEDIVKLCKIMENHLRTLDIESRVIHPLPELDLNSLISANIRGNHLDFISSARNLKSLSIRAHAIGSFNLDFVVDALRNFQLKELKIHYHLSNPRITKEKLSDFALACDSLEKLEFIGIPWKSGTVELWPTIASLPNIKSVRISEPITPSIIPQLRLMEEVDVRALIPIRLGSQVGKPLCTLWDNDIASYEDIEKLEACENLRILKLRLFAGAEIALIRSCANLRSLELTWGKETGLDTTQLRNLQNLRTVDEGAVREIIKRSPKLEVLLLRGAQFDLKVIMDVLRTLGSTLSEFRVDMGFGGPEFTHNMVHTLSSAAAYCTNLSCLYPAELFGTIPHTFQVAPDLQEPCLVLLNSVRESNPSLRILPLRKLIIGF